MYTILTTYPPDGCRNVGDQLIEASIKNLITHVKGETEFLTLFREDDLTEHLEQINQSKAVVFLLAIRDTPLWPNTYRLTENLADIKVPFVPIGATYNIYPGDYQTRTTVEYSDKTKDFLRYLSTQTKSFSCREYHTCKILQDNGINNALMTGDPAWYEVEKLGQPMHRPEKIKKLVFSSPLSPFYLEQAKDVMVLLSEMFPNAEKYCVFHTADLETFKDARPENSFAMSQEVTDKNIAVAKFARKLGFKPEYLFGEVEKLQFYHSCDLHVGYECHAHLYFLRQRLPSIMIIEDARGKGFSYSLGSAIFNGFKRCPGSAGKNITKKITSGYCTSLKEYSIAPVNPELIDQLKQYLEEELENKFRRISTIASVIDDTYFSAMQPFLEDLP
jgi:Polysaccharide pyruvyl transferase